MITVRNRKIVIGVNNQHKDTAFALCAIIFLPAINNFLNCILQIALDLSANGITEIFYVFMFCLAMGAFLKHWTQSKTLFIVTIALWLGIFLSYIIYPEMRHAIYGNPIDLVYNAINKVVFFCIPSIYLVANIRDFKALFDKMTKWAVITVILGLLTYVLCVIVAGEKLQYMVYSYHMLTAICVCFEAFRKTSKITYLSLTIFGIIAIVVCGARGAIVSIAVYIIVRAFAMNSDMRMSQRFSLMSLITAAIVLFFAFYENLLNTLQQFGISSHFLSTIQDGTFFYERGRSSLLDIFMKDIWENPLGYGFFGDRLITGRSGLFDYNYAHNIFLEVYADFGIFLGTILLTCFFFGLFKCINKTKNNYLGAVLWSLIPFGLFQLMFSSNMMENHLFYMICTIIYITLRRKQYEIDS